MRQIILYGTLAFLFISCEQKVAQTGEVTKAENIDSLAAYDVVKIDSVKANSAKADQLQNSDTLAAIVATVIDTKNTQPGELVNFAESLIGIPYRYGSTDPKVGFDCSGFITYVFRHFNISVPRSSIDFTDVEKEIPPASAKRGDIILFTGTDSTEHFVGHMGIVVAHRDTLKFIHSTSGKIYGVTITPLNKYYQSRFVKTIRVFKENDG